jgi:hypothetical protein
MSFPTINPRDRRALAVGAIVIVAALILARGVPALFSWTAERQSSAAELTTELRALRNALATQRERRAQLAAGAASLARLEAGLLAGATPVSAAAALAQLVGRAADSAGIHVRSTQVRGDTARTGAVFTTVSVRIDATADVRGLTSLLARLERGPALMVISALSVTQLEPESEMEALQVELTVEGLSRPGAKGGS